MWRMKCFDKSLLLPGDCLIYFTRDLFGWVTAIKTWSKTSHVEVYAGEGMSMASRNGKGVNLYPYRADGLVCVRRPLKPLDLESANHWFNAEARFQGYDWTGLLCFALAAKQGAEDRMFCSEFETRWYRHASLQPFDPDWDADRVPPSFFLVSPLFETIWIVGELH